MPSRKFAVLLDGGFVAKKLRGKEPCTAEQVTDACNRIKGHPSLEGYDLLRIYYYDAKPATDRLTNPLSGERLNLGQTPVHSHFDSLLNKLEMQPDFALRLGETVTHGWKIGPRASKSLVKEQRPIEAHDLVPDVMQKGVDLRIGLDIARLSLRGLVDVIVVVTGDSDLVPAFKFARREGLRVFLDHMGHSVRRELKAHVDLVL